MAASRTMTQPEGEEIGLTSGKAMAQKNPWLVRLKLVALAFLGVCAGVLIARALPASRNRASEAAAAPLRFLVVGDWGREGQYNQSVVAETMGIIAEQLNVNFVISTGDNFYEHGLSSIEDPLFESSFSNIYTARSLQTLWYAVLGNHDYVQVAAVQTDPALKLRDPRWHCERKYSIIRSVCPIPEGNCNATAEFFFIDTNPFVTDYWNSSLNFTGLGTRETEVTQSLEALEASLLSSNATWKLVIGHHPIRSMGDHGDTIELIETLLPVLEDNHVDMYINGHDHALELIKRLDSPIPLLTSGAGSKCYRPQKDAVPEDGLLFDHNGQGFVAMGIAPTWLHADFHGVEGALLYSYHVTK